MTEQINIVDQIEDGVWVRLRNGYILGPIIKNPDAVSRYVWTTYLRDADGCYFWTWTETGEYFPIDGESTFDITAAYRSSPIVMLETHIDELQNKIDGDKSCCCSYDNPGDVCSHHSPKLKAAYERIKTLEAALQPFASEAKGYVLIEPGVEPTEDGLLITGHDITVGHVRAAHKALKEKL